MSREATAVRAWAEGRTISVELHDGRFVGFPAEHFQRLAAATDEELQEVEVGVQGFTLRWEKLDEDISVAGILADNSSFPHANSAHGTAIA